MPIFFLPLLFALLHYPCSPLQLPIRAATLLAKTIRLSGRPLPINNSHANPLQCSIGPGAVAAGAQEIRDVVEGVGEGGRAVGGIGIGLFC